MFFPPGAMTSAYGLNGTPFVALSLPYQHTGPQPVGYAYPSMDMHAAAVPYAYSPAPQPYPHPQYGGSVVMGSDAHTVNNASGGGGAQKGARGHAGASVSSCETSPVLLASSAWGLSRKSSESSATSSLSGPPIYVVLQSPPQNPQATPPQLGTYMPPPPPPPPQQENGTKYELGEWYEGVVKRYNPMRGFGFLTATHHLKVISPPPKPLSHSSPPPSILQEEQEMQQQEGERAAVKEASTITTTTDTAAARNIKAAATMQPGDMDVKSEPHPELQARVERTPVTVGDIFVHQSYIKMQGFRALSIGDKVVFRIGVLPGKKAHQAVSVQRVQGSENKETATPPAMPDDKNNNRINKNEYDDKRLEETSAEEKRAAEKSALPSAHTRRSLEQLLQNLTSKAPQSENGEAAPGLTFSMLSRDITEAMGRCTEGCNLPTPTFNRNFVSFGLANAMDDAELTPCGEEDIFFPDDVDNICDFLSPFDDH